MTRGVALAIVLVLAGGLACGSVKPLGMAQPGPDAPAPGADPEGGSSSGADSSPEASNWQTSEPLYAITTRVSTAGGASHTFLLTVPGIGPGTSFDLQRAVRLPDTDSAAFGTKGRPFAYVTSVSSPTITRWRVHEDGSLEQSDFLSFASLGLRRADSAEALPFFARDKAYFCNRFDPSQIVIWNPETLTIRGTIPLELPLEGQLRPQVVLSQRADRLLAIVSWQQAFAYDWTRFGDRVQILSIDPASDTVVGRTEESRCNQFSSVSSASDATAYFSPASYYAPLRAMLGAPIGVDSCALRILPGADGFEPGYGVELPSITGGRPAGDFLLASDTSAFLRVWHSELVTPLDDGKSNWEAVMQEPGFLWWSWQVGAAQAERVRDQRPSNEAQIFVVDDKSYTSTLSQDRSSTQLEQLDPEGVLRPGLSGPGHIIGVFRVR